jgi:methionine-gamma-lyase
MNVILKDFKLNKINFKELVMNDEPATRMQDYLVFGEYGGVNPSIEDSSTFTFLSAEKMHEVFEHDVEGCFLYSRHLNPTTRYLGNAISAMEGTEDTKITSSGMAAISCAVLQICNTGDEIISSRTIYGGTYALFKNFLPRLGINTHFVKITDIDAIKAKINNKTKIIYCESISNPLLEVPDIQNIRKLADEHGLILIIDNTFSPLMISPYKLGAHVVIYSLTKFVNGASDCVAGSISGSKAFIDSLRDVNSGAGMLLGPVLDSLRSSSIFKNMRTLNVRMPQHSKNAMFIAENLEKAGIKVFYPGLKSHPQHELMTNILNKAYGYGGMVTIDAKYEILGNKLMVRMQEEKVGYFAVSLGFYKTLFSSPGTSTSSEIPKEEQIEMGMSPGLVRLSIGLDQEIENSYNRMIKVMKEIGLL